MRTQPIHYEDSSTRVVCVHHVKDITKFVESGQHDDALTALDDLLLLGPGNTNALKLKAFILHQQGLFRDEEAIWHSIIDKDPEDLDAIEYLYRRHIEEREHFYFTDDLPQGRRYLANPRSLMNMTLLLLVGCVLFLTVSGYGRKYLFLASPDVMVSLFGLMVVLPLLGILTTYLRSLREVLVSVRGIRIITLLRAYEFSWTDLDSIHLAHFCRPAGDMGLSLLIFPNKQVAPEPIEIDLSPDRSSLRARTFFIDEIRKHFAGLAYSKRENLELGSRRIQSF